jgi:transposase
VDTEQARMAVRCRMKATKRKYTEEFKRDAVRLLFESKKPLDVVARELQVASASLFNWRAKYGGSSAGADANAPLEPSERAELEALRRRVRDLEEDRVILKKAAAFFARESTK